MRSRIHLDINTNYIVILTILLILLFSNIVIAQELFIEVNDEVYENEDFLVSAYTLTLDENDIPTPTFQIGVEIEFNDRSYNITDEAVVSIKAPQVSEDTQYVINASKSGYISVEKTYDRT